jgi:L-ribulokinase
MSAPSYSIGLDFGTGSARALVARTADGQETGIGVAPFGRGDGGIFGDDRDPNVARQHPSDWAEAMERALTAAIEAARAADGDFSAERVVGIGIDATASTPLPVDSRCVPLALDARFARDLDALAWLWKDHTAHAEAEEITALAAKEHPEYLAKCGGAYSSEWYFAKLLRCLRVAPRVMEAADGWLEEGDYIAALLTGAAAPRAVKRNACAAGHKALFHVSWGGFPRDEFLSRVDARLGDWFRGRRADRAFASDELAGRLTRGWADRFGLATDLPVAVAGIDAHVGAVGAGIRPGVLVKILGTSGCDLLVHPIDAPIADIPGISGIARDSILPGCLGLEAGQAAVGDIFAWFVRELAQPAGLTHESLGAEAARLGPGESGLVALDWNNGNRSLLADPRLTGLLVGQTLQTRPAEIYRSLLEATAFGARAIVERFEEHRVRVEEVVACGGIAKKSPLLLQIYADVTGRAIKVSRSSETCALGAAVFGAVVGGAWKSVADAVRAMTGVEARDYEPSAAAKAVYDELFAIYLLLHDAFGARGKTAGLHSVMKRLIEIRERSRGRN